MHQFCIVFVLNNIKMHKLDRQEFIFFKAWQIKRCKTISNNQNDNNHDSFLEIFQNPKKKRIVGRVRCKNIKDECPKPTCKDPVLLPGRCCKVCSGQNDSKYQAFRIFLWYKHKFSYACLQLNKFVNAMLRFYYHEFSNVLKSRSKGKKCSGLSKH